MATLMMLFGHTVDALLGTPYRSSAAFAVWTFLRGLTPTTFTLVSGFALSLVALHHSTHETARASGLRRLRRFAFFFVLGYGLHYPAANLLGLTMLTPADIRLFTAVDVLQCTAVTLAVLQLLLFRIDSPMRFLVWSAGLAAFFCLLTPLAWRASLPLPEVLTAYVNPTTGSIFPLFPWFANGALGAAIGAGYLLAPGATPGAKARRTLLPLGITLVALAVAMRVYGWEPFGAVNLGAGRPSQFCLQVGLVSMALAALASLVDLRPVRIRPVEDFAQESLTVYVVHVCIVYGSPWNPGLRQAFGATLSPAMVGLTVVGLWLAMIALGLVWSGFKRTAPTWAARTRFATLSLLFVLLLV